MKEKDFWASVGTGAMAILASSCCWLPLILLALGAGTARVSYAKGLPAESLIEALKKAGYPKASVMP
ncbi:MAG: hypothetical protein ACK44W_09095 [Planctomycetota bacterium]